MVLDIIVRIKCRGVDSLKTGRRLDNHFVLSFVNKRSEPTDFDDL